MKNFALVPIRLTILMVFLVWPEDVATFNKLLCFVFPVAPLSPTKMAIFRKTSLEELLKSKMPNGGQWPMNVIHITENPISAVVC